MISHLSMFECQVPVIDFDTVLCKGGEKRGERTTSALRLRAAPCAVSSCCALRCVFVLRLAICLVQSVPLSVGVLFSWCLHQSASCSVGAFVSRRLVQSVTSSVGVFVSRCLHQSSSCSVSALVGSVLQLAGALRPCVLVAS